MSYLSEHKKTKYFPHKNYAVKNTALDAAWNIANRLVDDANGSALGKNNLLFPKAVLSLVVHDIYRQLAEYPHIVAAFIYDINKHNQTRDEYYNKLEQGRFSVCNLVAISNRYLSDIVDPVFAYIEKNVTEDKMFLFGVAIANFLDEVLVKKNEKFYSNPYYWSLFAKDSLEMDVSSVATINSFENVAH